MKSLLEIGKLYLCSSYDLLVFPTKEIAEGIPRTMGATSCESATLNWVQYWSAERCCRVSFIPVGQIFCCVDVDKKDFGLVHIVYGEIMGWVIVGPKWVIIQELVA